MSMLTLAQPRPATTTAAPGHRDVAFCNTDCQRCDHEMAIRSERYRHAETASLRLLMQAAPTGR